MRSINVVIEVAFVFFCGVNPRDVGFAIIWDAGKNSSFCSFSWVFWVCLGLLLLWLWWKVVEVCVLGVQCPHDMGSGDGVRHKDFKA